MSATPTQAPATGQVQQIDPATLVIAMNVRGTVALDPAFVASIRDLGVLEPVTAVREGEELRVRYGQRRTLGAVEAQVATIPVRVIDADQDQALRIVTQMAENDHRAPITDADRVTAYEQLTGLGLTAAQIAKRTHRPMAEVTAATAASTSKAATDALAQHQDTLSLMDAAAIAEFEGDDTVIAAIIDAARDGESTAHVVQQARDERTTRAAIDAAAELLTEQGVTVVTRPDYNSTTTTLDRLRGSREATRPLSATEHAACPGHAAYIQRAYTANGYEYAPVYLCTDPSGNGHTTHDPYGGNHTTASGPMSEEQKAERRTVIANNKAWDAATTVRAEWLQAFAKGTGKLPDAERFIAHAVARGECPGYDYEKASDATRIDRMGPTAATRYAAAAILGTWHARSSRHTWRNPSAQDARMITALIAWGYTPGPVEKLLLPKAKATRATRKTA